jgi:phospholipid/cholesterol/gamma-HCH transport system substrate-binding protein
MDDRIVKFRMGVVVLFVMIVLGIMVVLFNNFDALWHGSYTVFVHFSQAPGVAADTPVRKDGILIGKVVKVRFADDDPRFQTEGGVIVTVKIHADRRLHLNERCRISTTLLGDAVLQFVPGGSHPSPDYIQNGDYLEGIVAPNPLELLTNLESNITGVITSISGAGNDVGRLARRLDDVLGGNEDQLRRIVNKTERSLDTFQKALQSINVLLGDVDAAGASLRNEDGSPMEFALDEPTGSGDASSGNGQPRSRRVTTLPQLMAETRDAILEMRTAVVNANKILTDLKGLTQPLGDNGPELIAKVDRSVGRLNEALEQFVIFGQALNSKDGTLGQLLKNPELYQNVNAIVCNVDQLIRRMRPIVEDVRAFTDKMSRHPGGFIRDALQPGPGIK